MLTVCHLRVKTHANLCIHSSTICKRSVLVPPLVTAIVSCYLQSLNWINFKVVFLRPFGKEMTKRKREETQIVSQLKERKS